MFDSDADIERYVDALPFSVSGTFGGHTACVEIGTGTSEPSSATWGRPAAVRPAAIALHGPALPQTYHLVVSHVHWDHIMGLPFFGPAYIPGNRLVFYGAHRDLEAALRRQMEPPSFPVNFSVFNADIRFVYLEPGQTHDVAGMRVTVKRQHHAGDSYGYRFERDGRTVVYTTDSEHTFEDPDESAGFAKFFRKADVVVFDAMYSLAEAISVKADWGHSSNIVGVELCQLVEPAPVPVPSRAGSTMRRRDDAEQTQRYEKSHALAAAARVGRVTGWN
jgi:ribonuclease BN (tRNA processing enzyme)